MINQPDRIPLNILLTASTALPLSAFRIFSIVLCGLFISSCGTLQNMMVLEDVKPWQKDILAQKSMKIPSDSMFSYSDDHIFFSKEASTGGQGVGGGGCGCN